MRAVTPGGWGGIEYHVVGVDDCVRDRFGLRLPEPTEGQRIGNEIKAAMIFARGGFHAAIAQSGK